MNHKKTLNLMKELRIKAIYTKPSLSVSSKEHKKYPYLLKDRTVTSVNEVWQLDMTYLKLSGGFAYLSTIIDVFFRKVLAWDISNTLDTSFCLESIKKAISGYGVPFIINSDQGARYTSSEFTGLLTENNILISMNSKGRALDNIYIERFFRSSKCEDICLNRYNTVKDAAIGINDYFHDCNADRLHQSLDYLTPDEVYYANASADGLSIAV